MTFKESIYILYSRNPYHDISKAPEAVRYLELCDRNAVLKAKRELEFSESEKKID